MIGLVDVHLATALSKAEAMARLMDGLGYNCFWLAEHHFQPEGTECIPNTILMALHLAHRTKNIKIGCGFNITPMWHPLRLAEDFAMADILTGGRIVFGVGRGYHTREVETFGTPLRDQWFRTRERKVITEPILRDFGTVMVGDAVLAYDKQELLKDEHGRPITRQDPHATKLHPITGEEIPDPHAKLPEYRYVNARPAQWPEAEFVVGNPPFIGKGEDMRTELGLHHQYVRI